MRPFDTLDYRSQVGRLRRLAATAVADYDVEPTRLWLLAHLENSVESRAGERYVLRVHRTSGSPWHPVRSAAEVQSELRWLEAIRRDTDLGVPSPVRRRDGALLTVAATAGVPEPRICALFRWVAGRFANAGLTATHLERVGRFMARLHEHAQSFSPPAGFDRWRIGDVSKEASAYVADMLSEVVGRDDAAIALAVIDRVQETRRSLGEGPDIFGLIHADLHQENYLFHRGTVRAIDFDDCGWGHFPYDLAVTLSEISSRPDYDDWRAALLRGYRSVRAFPESHEHALESFRAFRGLLLTLWFLDQRHHPAFSDWEDGVRSGLTDLAAFVYGSK
jgi:Ser/Thr protein kinase RdoA (MazF antagonist)